MPSLPRPQPCGSQGRWDRREGPEPSGLLVPTLRALLPPLPLPGNSLAWGRPPLDRGPPCHTLSLHPLCPFSVLPLLHLLLQPARHELPLVLEPSQVCPLLLVAHISPAAPQTAAARAAAPPPRPFPLLCAWLPSQEDPWGLSPASSWVWYSSLLPLDLGLVSLAAYRTHTHVCTVHTQLTQLAQSNFPAFKQHHRLSKLTMTTLHDYIWGLPSEVTYLRAPSRLGES